MAMVMMMMIKHHDQNCHDGDCDNWLMLMMTKMSSSTQDVLLTKELINKDVWGHEYAPRSCVSCVSCVESLSDEVMR